VIEPLPKPVKQALENPRRSAGPHPDADLLVAFQEGAVTAHERERLLTHFAACAHCREVMRLSLPVPERTQQVVVPAVAGWRRWLNWAAVAATVVVLGSVGIIYQVEHHGSKPVLEQGSEQAGVSATHSDTSPAPAALPRHAAKTTAPSDNAKAVAKPPEPAAGEASLERKPEPLQKKVAPSLGLGMKTGSASSSTGTAVKVPDYVAGGGQTAAEAISPSTIERGPLRAPFAGTIGAGHSGTGGEASSRAPAAPSASSSYQSDSMATRSQALQAPGTASQAQRQTASLPHSRAAFDSAAPVRPQWRISPAGELQRAFAGSDWQTVLASAHTKFHALALVGNDVWAGGSEANLFHSTDGGTTWTRVPLPTQGPAAPTITRITWDDALNGIVGTDTATIWATADGGRTWTQR
jgi:hypothetical protein